MIKQLMVLDENGTQVGMTFPKRAKQLIIKQRAFWKDETHAAICLLPVLKEVTVLNDDFNREIYNSRKDAPDYAKDNDLLLYIAKQRVNQRKRLVKHIMAYIAAWMVLIFFYSFIFGNMNHPLYSQAQSVNEQLYNLVVPAVSEAGLGNAEQLENIISEVDWIMYSLTYSRYTHPLWYLLLGAMIFWGVGISVYLIKAAAEKLHKRSAKKSRPDPVILEYQRLKDMTSEGVEWSKFY